MTPPEIHETAEDQPDWDGSDEVLSGMRAAAITVACFLACAAIVAGAGVWWAL